MRALTRGNLGALGSSLTFSGFVGHLGDVAGFWTLDRTTIPGRSAVILRQNGIAISMDGKGIGGRRICRAPVAQRQIRVGLSAGLRQRIRGPHFDRPLLGLL